MKKTLSILLSLLMALSAFSVMPFNASAANYEISATSNDASGGTVSGGGIYISGQDVTLTAQPNEGYVFECWTLEGDEMISRDLEIRVTADGNKNYKALFWKVLADFSGKSYAYTGQGIEPQIENVSLQGVETLFIYGQNYTVSSYESNVHAGEAIARLEFAGDYKGTATAKFTITQQQLTVTALSAEKEYDGKPLTAGYESTPLVGNDYFKSVNVSGSQTDVGSSENTVKEVVIHNDAHGACTDDYEIYFVPGTLKVNTCEITDDNLEVTLKDNVYDGAAKEPEIRINGNELKKGKDYTVKYQDASGKYVDYIYKKGKYTVTVTGKGNCKGEASKTVTVEPEDESVAAEQALNGGLRASSNAKAATVRWGKAKTATKYVIYAAYCTKKDKNKCKKIATLNGKKTKYAIKKLKGKKLNQKKNVKVYVVAYKGKEKLATSETLHIAGYKTKFSNAKKIKLKKNKFTLAEGKSAKIKGRVILENKKKKPVSHIKKLRFKSSNDNVATVDRKGKIIAKGKGECIIYVFANNGKVKKAEVTVK